MVDKLVENLEHIEGFKKRHEETLGDAQKRVAEGVTL